jgi:hypothetical protein
MEPKRIFIILCIVLVISIGLVSIGIAYAGGVRGMGLLGVLFFLTFGIIVVLAQIIPAGILLSSFIGEIFSSFRKTEAPVRATWD